MKNREQEIETPAGWERGRHCGYLAFSFGGWVVYENPKGSGWVRIHLAPGQDIPGGHRLFASLFAATGGIGGGSDDQT